MTALITLERTKLSRVMTTVRYHGAPAESVIGLRAGERMTVADLLRSVLLASANDAAATLAAGVGGSQRAFVALMNTARASRAAPYPLRQRIGLDDPATTRAPRTWSSSR